MSTLFRRKEERRGLWQRIRDVALTDVGVLVRGLDEDALERLEELLLAADFGVAATLRLVDRMEALTRKGGLRTEEGFRAAVAAEIVAILERGSQSRELRRSAEGPTVILMIGVNGVGKTTTIGKLAHALALKGHRVVLGAADTFRAGAIDQLRIWAQRSGAELVSAQPGADPAAVAFDAIDACEARGADTLIVDTAGRLHTQRDLMTELTKVRRVVDRRLPGAPHETLLVLDATVGQNALVQVRIFGADLDVSGLVLAKLDTTAKGGAVVALREEFDIPVKLVGTGEGIENLAPFDPASFADAVLAG